MNVENLLRAISVIMSNRHGVDITVRRKDETGRIPAGSAG